MFIRKSHRVRSCKIPSDALRRGARPQWRMAGVFGERTDTGATSSPASRDPLHYRNIFEGGCGVTECDRSEERWKSKITSGRYAATVGDRGLREWSPECST